MCFKSEVMLLSLTQHSNHSLAAFVVGNFSLTFSCAIGGGSTMDRTSLQSRAFLHGHSNP